MSGVNNLYLHPSASDNTQTFTSPWDTRFVDSIALDITVASFTGGTAPTITFFVDRLGADGITWSQVWTSGAISAAPSSIAVDLGRFGMTYAAGTVTGQHVIFTTSARLRWAWGGSANPTAVTWYASAIGRG